MTTPEPPGLVAAIGAGQVIVGGWVSLTVTVKLHVLLSTELPHVTVVVPFGKKEPEGGVQVTVPQLPLVVGGR